jgi:lipopolysaccharide export system permease protein
LIIRKLDMYIAFRFMRMIAMAVAAFVVIYVSVDAFEHFSRWVDRNVGVATFASYYFYGLPYIVVLVMPVAVLLCSLFLVHSLARRNELMAMTCAGISIQRTYAPLLVVGLLASVFEMAVGDFVVSEAMYRQAIVKRVEIDGHEPLDYSRRSDFAYRALDGSILDVGYYDGRTGNLTDVTILGFGDSSTISRRLDARRLVPSGSGWMAIGAELREFGPGGSLVYTSADTLPVPGLRETPEDFGTRPRGPTEMNFLELTAYIRREEAAGGDTREDTVELLLKFFFPLSSLIMVLVGAPLAARNPRSGKTMSIGMAILLAFIFFSLLRFGQTLGHKGSLDPLLAASLADGVFILLGLGLMFRPGTS